MFASVACVHVHNLTYRPLLKQSRQLQKTTDRIEVMDNRMYVCARTCGVCTCVQLHVVYVRVYVCMYVYI
jgi:hypothetical protein